MCNWVTMEWLWKLICELSSTTIVLMKSQSTELLDVFGSLVLARSPKTFVWVVSPRTICFACIWRWTWNRFTSDWPTTGTICTSNITPTMFLIRSLWYKKRRKSSSTASIPKTALISPLFPWMYRRRSFATRWVEVLHCSSKVICLSWDERCVKKAMKHNLLWLILEPSRGSMDSPVIWSNRFVVSSNRKKGDEVPCVFFPEEDSMQFFLSFFWSMEAALRGRKQFGFGSGSASTINWNLFEMLMEHALYNLRVIPSQHPISSSFSSAFMFRLTQDS